MFQRCEMWIGLVAVNVLCFVALCKLHCVVARAV